MAFLSIHGIVFTRRTAQNSLSHDINQLLFNSLLESTVGVFCETALTLKLYGRAWHSKG
jgi:hypothetical protein